MMRKLIAPWLRVGIAAATWAVTVAAVEAAAENEIGHTTRKVVERIELQLELMDRFGAPAAPNDDVSPPARPRSHEESIEPWELVGV